MAGLDLTPIKAGRGGRTPLASIDPTVVETVEEAFAFCSQDASRLQTPAFASKDDGEDWLSEARSYAYQRPVGRVVVEGNTSQARTATGGKDGAKYVVRFRVVPFIPASSDEPNGASE